MIQYFRELIFSKAQKRVTALSDMRRGKISDGYHTFDELYDHRITLFIAFLKLKRELEKSPQVIGSHIVWAKPEPSHVWRTTKHSDNSVWQDWFILGIYTEPGKQITYHVPNSRWQECDFAMSILKASEWDGHTSEDVLQRLKAL